MQMTQHVRQLAQRKHDRHDANRKREACDECDDITAAEQIQGCGRGLTPRLATCAERRAHGSH
jgi:hypothetical protein